MNPLFLTAAVLLGVPVLLHLWMRQKPQKIMFPAVLFLKSREKTQKRTLRIKHLILLLLRIFLIVTLVLIFARPRVHLSGGIVGREAPTAVIMLFDTSSRMEYRYENRTRLEAAKEIAQKLIQRFPKESQIAVVSTRPGVRGFIPDRAEAARQVNRLETTGVGNSLIRTLFEVMPLYEKTDIPRRELFIFTDMSAEPWKTASEARFRELLKKYADTAVYIIDVRAEHIANDTLDIPEVPSAQYGTGGTLTIKSRVISQDGNILTAEEESKITDSSATQKNVAIYMLDADGIPQKRGETVVHINPGASAPIEFQITGLTPGPNQGFLEILSADAIDTDNRRYFTVEVSPPTPILLIAPHPAEETAFFVKQALAPTIFEREKRSRFLCDVISQEDLSTNPQNDDILNTYKTILIIDPTEIPAGVWQKLFERVNAGAGLGIFLGPNAANNTNSFNAAEAQQLLPAKLEFQARKPEGVMFAPTSATKHPVMKDLTAAGAAVPWPQMPVFRYWQLSGRNPGVENVLAFTGGDPAILHRNVGAGRVLVMTTPPSDTDSPRWNQIAHSGSWVFVVLMNRMAEWLSAESETSANVLTGRPFSLAVGGTGQRFEQYTLIPFPNPGATQPITLSPDPREPILDISGVEKPSNYRVIPIHGSRDWSERSERNDRIETPSDFPPLSGRSAPFHSAPVPAAMSHGFSANIPLPQTDLTRLPPTRLQELFNPHPIYTAKNMSRIEQKVSAGRMGVELFTPLVVIFMILMMMEIWLSNRFYRKA